MDKHIDALLELRLGCRFDSEWSQQAAEQVAALDAAIALMRGQSDMVLVPRELTAENGAKAALIGEVQVRLCEGQPWVPVSWTTIKELHRKMVAHFHPDPPKDSADEQ